MINSTVNGLLTLYYAITNLTGAPLVVEGVAIAPGFTQDVFISQHDLTTLNLLNTNARTTVVGLTALTVPTPTVSG